MKGKNLKYPDSLLRSFIGQKVDDYIEPVYRGRPRSGKRLGLSPEKYAAALLHLRNYKIKQIAEEVEVSYGLLRKWRTEGLFLDTIDKLEFDFVDLLIKHLGKRGQVQRELIVEFSKKSIKEIIETPRPYLGWKEFSDIKSYGNSLMLLIIGSVSRHRQELDAKLGSLSQEDFLASKYDFGTFYQCSYFMELLAAYPFKSKKDFEKADSTLKPVRDRRLEDHRKCLFALLQMKDFSEEVRKMAILFVQELTENYEIVDIN